MLKRGKIILLLLAATLMLIGVVCIFDARIITVKLFSFGDQNEATFGLKIIGFLLAITGGLIFFFNMM